MTQDQHRLKRRLVGKVVSDKATQSLTVEVTSSMQHPLGKYIKRRSKIHAHDEKELASRGDIGVIEEGRPISKTKSWRLVYIEKSVKDGSEEESMKDESGDLA